MDRPTNGNDEPKKFGALLRQFRLDRQMSQRTLAELAGLSLEAISTLERGFRQSPRRATLLLIASGLALSPEDQELLLSTAVSVPRPRPNSGRARTERSLHNIPQPQTRLIGRSADLHLLGELIRTQALVTIAGPGGIGKTQLSIALALELKDEFADGVWFIDLAPVTDRRGLLATIAGILDVSTSRAQDPVAALAVAIETQQCLLVLDNCEHLVDDVGRLAETILAKCPGIRILATSRYALNARNESVFLLPPLSLPDENDSRYDEDAFEATKLFIERARDIDANFALTAHNAATIAEICRRLDGLPLSIELAARRTRSLSPVDLLKRLDHRLSLLTGGRNKVARQQSLRALLDWSYDLLDERDREFFESLGVFPSSFSLDAVRNIAYSQPQDDYHVLDRLESLAAKSLIVRSDLDDGTTRYALLETLREFAAERLNFRGQAEITQNRFFDYFYGLFVSAGNAFEHEPLQGTLAAVVPETKNRVAALEIALSRGDAKRGSELLLAIRFPREMDDYVVNMTRQLAEMIDQEEYGLIARLWARHAYDSYSRSSEASIIALDKALGAARNSGDPCALAFTLQTVASVSMRLADLDRAEYALEESARLPLTAALTYTQKNTEALLATYAEEYSVAAHRFHAIVLSEQARGNIDYTFLAQINRAEAEFAAGDTKKAIAVAREGRHLVEQAGRRERAQYFANYTAYLVTAGDYDAARAIGRRALIDAGNSEFSLFVIDHLALAEAREGRLERAAILSGFSRASVQRFTPGVRHFTEVASQTKLSALLAELSVTLRADAEERGASLLLRDIVALLENKNPPECKQRR